MSAFCLEFHVPAPVKVALSSRVLTGDLSCGVNAEHHHLDSLRRRNAAGKLALEIEQLGLVGHAIAQVEPENLIQGRVSTVRRKEIVKRVSGHVVARVVAVEKVL